MVTPEQHNNIAAYDISSLDDELRVDSQCLKLLRDFHTALLNQTEIDALTAGSLARGADYFLRDYMIDRHRTNIFKIDQDLIRGFAGNWYIVSTIEPTIEELTDILEGVTSFYGYCNDNGLISNALFNSVANTCKEISFFKSRIESFFAIEDGGFNTWKNICPIP